MLAEFSIYPLQAEHMSKDVAKVVETLESAGLHYHLGPMSTAVEGNWEQVMEAIRPVTKWSLYPTTGSSLRSYWMIAKTSLTTWLR